MNWPVFVANWIVNDYQAVVKRHGPASDDRFVWVALLLRLWFIGVLPGTAARAWLRRVVTA